MSRYQFTLHVEQKLKLSVYKKLGINKSKLENTIENPQVVDKSDDPVHIAIATLNQKLSICVAYRKLKVSGIIRVITFYPAEKGRYENKILQRG